MVSRRNTYILIGAILAAGTAFCIGRTVATAQRVRVTGVKPAWLVNGSPAAVQAERRFEQLVREQTDVVRAEQALLASMLPDIRFTGEQILAQVDKVMQSHATLAKSVGVHLSDLRGILTGTQGRRLMSSCANSLQGSVQRRYRWRGGAQEQGEGFTGGRRGGSGRGEGGRGNGYGRQYRGGSSDSTSGLARRLRLTQEQITWAQQQDPNFDEECVSLRTRLYEEHARLVTSFENAQMPDGELTTRVDDLVAAHAALEKRVAQHIVLLRPRLSQEQRDLLSSLCRGRSRTNGGHLSAGRDAISKATIGLLGEESLASLL